LICRVTTAAKKSKERNATSLGLMLHAVVHGAEIHGRYGSVSDALKGGEIRL
jgi:hypothetical protein